MSFDPNDPYGLNIAPVNDPVSLEANQNYALNSINSGMAGDQTPLTYQPTGGIDSTLSYLKNQLAIDTKSNLILPSTGLPPADGYTQNALNGAGHPDPGSIGDMLLWLKTWIKNFGSGVLIFGGLLLVLFIVIKANK